MKMSKEAYIGHTFLSTNGEYWNFDVEGNSQKEGFSFPKETFEKNKSWKKEELTKNGKALFFINNDDGKTISSDKIKNKNGEYNGYEGYYLINDADKCKLFELISVIETGKYYKVKNAEGKEVTVNIEGKEVIVNAEGKEVLFRDEAGAPYEFSKEVTFDEAIEYVKEQMSAREYQCDESILKSFYLGLQTDQLLLLTGKPGTGKSSFVRTFADVFDMIKPAMISVQANWTDRSDLLGYYNALGNSYMSTPFLDALFKFTKDAKVNTNKLHFICLDEMNLSHIEYYFADFLSKLQEKDPEIQLFSERLVRDYINELKDFCEIVGLKMDSLQDDSNTKDMDKTGNEQLDEGYYKKVNSVFAEVKREMQVKLKKENTVAGDFCMDRFLRLCKMQEMMEAFNWGKIKIPKNIKFIGTLNQDETTKDISPKVIDRAYVIRFGVEEDKQAGESGGATKSEETVIEQLVIKYKGLKEFSKGNDGNESGKDEANSRRSEDNLKAAIADLEKEKIIRYSKRAAKQTFEHLDYTAWCEAMGIEIVNDYFLASTVLPRISLFKSADDESYAAKVSKLKDTINIKGAENDKQKYPLSSKILEEITGSEEVYYWRS